MTPEMTVDAAVDLLRLLESTGIEVWLDGGWAVDAALGRQTRPHKDLDIILRVSGLLSLQEILGTRGFQVQDGGSRFNFVLANGRGLEVDVHAIVFNQVGDGVYRMSSGADWVFPAAGFGGRGELQGFRVRCLSPEVQVQCHAHGYIPTEKDFRDMELLHVRFGVDLPASLQRQR